MASPLTDLELLAAWRAGDRQAGSALFRRHFVGVRRLVQATTPPSAIESLVQQTFVACLHDHARFAAPTRFRPALFGLAYALIQAHHGAPSRHATPPDFTQVSVSELLAGGSEPPAPLRLESEPLLDALRRVPLDAQVLLQLRYWEQFSSAELADLLAIEPGTVAGRLERARALLERALGRSPEQLDVLRELEARGGPLDEAPLVTLLPSSLGGRALVDHRVVDHDHRFEYRSAGSHVVVSLRRRTRSCFEGQPLAVQGFRGRWSWNPDTLEASVCIQLGNNELVLRMQPADERESAIALLGELELPALARASA